MEYINPSCTDLMADGTQASGEELGDALLDALGGQTDDDEVGPQAKCP